MLKKWLHTYRIRIGLLFIFVAALGAALNHKKGGIGVYLFIGTAGCIWILTSWAYNIKAAATLKKKGLQGSMRADEDRLPCGGHLDDKTILLVEEDLEPLIAQLHQLIKKPEKRRWIKFRVQFPNGQTHAISNCVGVKRGAPVPEDPGEDPQSIEAYLEARLSLPHDSLTGLLSKASMMSLIGKELETRHAGEGNDGLFVIDINNYRVVNTRYGYSMGDQVLSEVGRRLNHLSSERVLVGRIESNNFVVFIKELQGEQEMGQMARQIQAVFERPINIGAGDIRITVSIGAAIAPLTGSSLDSVMSYALTALAQARAKGQSNNYQLFNSSMKQGADRRTQIIRILETHEKTGSLRVYYQPQYISKNGCIHGLEALLRVIDDQLGLVAPKEFIPIIDIGYWCIRECCRAIKRFRKEGLLFTAISINVSLVQLTALDFVDRIKEIILEEGIDPSMLAFEITESMLMCSMEHGENLLRQLKDFGVRVVLDDFGSGYSSLNYIRALSIDTLKIDKSFIDGICTDGKSKYIIQLILNLAEKINLEVVAEGVETEEQLNMLRSFSCPIIQGFYFSKPIPEPEVLNLLRSGA